VIKVGTSINIVNVLTVIKICSLEQGRNDFLSARGKLGYLIKHKRKKMHRLSTLMLSISCKTNFNCYFQGDPVLKGKIQNIAASQANKAIYYFPFNNNTLETQLERQVQISEPKSVGMLLIIRRYVS